MLKILRHELDTKKVSQLFALFYARHSKEIKASNNCVFGADFKTEKCNNRLNLKRNISTIEVLQTYSKPKKVLESIDDQEIGGTKSRPKQYIEYEAGYHHNVMENSSAYCNTVYKTDPRFMEIYRLSDVEFKELTTGRRDWMSESPHRVNEAFISLGIYSASNLSITMDDERFNDLICALVDKCSAFTDDQLIDCLIAIQIWPPSDHVKTEHFLKVWKILDKVCVARQFDWSIDKMLYIMDLWYCMKLVRLSDFVFKGLLRMSKRCNDLTRTQMIQAMFYMSCVRKIHPAISMREYEYYIQKHVTHLTIEEIAIYALAFFKTQTIILNEKLLLYTMQRVAQEVNTIKEISLTAIVKAIRFSYKPTLAFTANDLAQKLTEQRMDSLNLISSIHIGHIITKVQFYNELTITKVAEKFCANPGEARLKDMERVALLLSMYNYIPPSTPHIIDLIVQQLGLPQHVLKGEQHTTVLFSIVYFLTLLRTFPEELIQMLLSEDYLKTHFDNKHMMAIQVLQIEYNRLLEGPAGGEHLLSLPLREYLARKNSVFMPDIKPGKLNHFDLMLLNVIEHTKEVLGGEEYFMQAYTLPHFPRSDILFRLDAKGQPIPIPEALRQQRHFEDVIRPDGEGWRCVVVANRNLYMHNVPRLAGETIAKLRQLSSIGYTPIVIPGLYWDSEKNKSDYLKLKYFNLLK